jgi:hypothetical protein
VPRALVVSHDVIGPSMAGPGIRYWEMAAALRRRGVEVTLAAPAAAAGVAAVAVADMASPPSVAAVAPLCLSLSRVKAFVDARAARLPRPTSLTHC